MMAGLWTPYALLMTCRTPYRWQSRATASTSSGPRGAKQLVVVSTQHTAPGPAGGTHDTRDTCVSRGPPRLRLLPTRWGPVASMCVPQACGAMPAFPPDPLDTCDSCDTPGGGGGTARGTHASPLDLGLNGGGVGAQRAAVAQERHHHRLQPWAATGGGVLFGAATTAWPILEGGNILF